MFNFILSNKYVLKKIFHTPIEIFKLFKVKGEISGKKIFILGSAPNPNLELDSSRHVVVTINGSAANAKELGLNDSVMTVVDFELITKKVALHTDVRSVIIKNNLLKNIDLGSVVAIQSNNTLLGDPKILNANIKRVSDKPRNLKNRATFEEEGYIKIFKQEILEEKEANAIVREENNTVNVYYPIKTNGLCLQCHGNPKTDIKENVLASLKELYPNDKAVGYSINEIRGIWKVSLEK